MPMDAYHSDRFARLEGKRAFITGSSSGIGEAIALSLAEAGADLVLHCRHSIEAAESVVQKCRKLGRKIEFLAQDLSTDPLDGFCRKAWDVHGGLDIFVSNAGADILTGPTAKANFSEKLDQLYAVDVRASLLLARDIGQRLREAGSGCILTIGWDQADRGMEGDSGELFAATKNAVMGFTRSLALSLAPQVRVNCIAPGWIKTAWGERASDAWQQRVLGEIPLERWGTPQDIARLARFLVSDEASFITGQVWNVNGGAER